MLKVNSHTNFFNIYLKINVSVFLDPKSEYILFFSNKIKLRFEVNVNKMKVATKLGMSESEYLKKNDSTDLLERFKKEDSKSIHELIIRMEKLLDKRIFLFYRAALLNW